MSEQLLDNVEEEAVFVYASKGKRFLNQLLDYIFFYTISFMVGMVLGVIAPDFVMNPDNEIILRLMGFPIFIIYYTVFESLANGKTPGKMITGTIVVDEAGNPPSFGKALGRSLSRMIPFDHFSVLFSDGRGWHDSIPGTYVLDEKQSTLV